MKYAQYLGDSVYVHLSDFGDVVLTTGHHDQSDASNTIIMEPSVMAAFNGWVESTKAKLEAERNA